MFTRRLVTRSVPVALVCALAVAGCDSSSDSNDASSDTGSDSPATSGATTGDSSTEPGETSGSTTATESEPTAPATSEPSNTPSTGSTPTKTGPGDQHRVLSSLPGSSASKCVTIGDDDRTIRSGDLAVGDFSQARQSYGDSSESQEQTTVNMFVVPGDAKPMNGVTVRMTPTGSQGSGASVHSDAVEQADVWKYYPVDVPVPAPGTWKLVAATGQARGCYIVTFIR